MRLRNLTLATFVLLSLSIFPLMTKATTNACDPASHQAIADGKTVITQQLQQTINACSQHGGGIVSLHRGTWLSGPLSLKEGVTLDLEQGSILKADNSEGQFKRAFIGTPSQSGEAFILANHVAHVGITGSGIIDGSGKALWWPEALNMREITKFQGNNEYFLAHYPKIPVNNGVPRPWLIEFNDVANSRIGAILATNSPMWTIVLRHSQHISLDGTRIINPENIPNSDGIDIISSAHITMKDLYISTGDDNIAIKSDHTNKPSITNVSANIKILDSVIHKGHGISVGHNTTNEIGEIYIHNVRFEKTLNGFRIESARKHGSPIGLITLNNLKMVDVNIPLLLTENYTEEFSTSDMPLPVIKSTPMSKNPPLIHDVTITNLVAVNANIAGIFNGLPESPLKNIQLKYIDIRSRVGIKTAYTQMSAAHVHINPEQGHCFNLGPGTELTAK